MVDCVVDGVLLVVCCCDEELVFDVYIMFGVMNDVGISVLNGMVSENVVWLIGIRLDDLCMNIFLMVKMFCFYGWEWMGNIIIDRVFGFLYVYKIFIFFLLIF